MRISHNKPPHFGIMQKVFGCDWERTAFAFSNTIYSKTELPDHLIVHESVHLKQQGYNIIGAWIWLAFYLCSKRFRYLMEIQAYRKQWQFVKKNYRYNFQIDFLHKVSSDLSGNLYGNIISYDEAKRAIQS